MLLCVDHASVTSAAVGFCQNSRDFSRIFNVHKE